MNMTKYKIQTVLAAGLFLLAGCADEYQSDYQTDQPADVALANYVGSFDVLKAYAGSMHIGAEVSCLPTSPMCSRLMPSPMRLR